MGEHGWGRGERGGGGGEEESTTTAPNPPQAKPNPPRPAPKKRKCPFESSDESNDGAVPRPKRPNPPPPPHPTPPHGLRRPSPPPNPTTPPRPPPQTPAHHQDRHPQGCREEGRPSRGSDHRDGRPRTVRGIHGRKYGAVWVEYPGGTTLYEVNCSLLFPPPRRPSGTGKRPGRRAQRRPNPPPPQTKRLTPRTQTLPPKPLTQLTPLTPLNPHPDPQRCGTPLRGPTRYEGPDRDPRGHNGHGQET